MLPTAWVVLHTRSSWQRRMQLGLVAVVVGAGVVVAPSRSLGDV